MNGYCQVAELHCMGMQIASVSSTQERSRLPQQLRNWR